MANENKQMSLFGEPKKLAIIIGVALVARLIYLIEIQSAAFVEYLTADPAFFDSWARSILGENFFPDETLYRAPLYSYFLAILYTVSGKSVLFASLIQSILGAVTCALVYSVSRRYFGETVGLIAGLVASLYGAFIYLDVELDSNILGALFTLSAILTLAKSEEKPTTRRFLLAGVFFGLAALAEPHLLAIPIFILLWMMIRFNRSASWKLARWGVVLGGAAICILPVTLHNAAHSGDFLLISGSSGIKLFAGNNVQSDGMTPYLPAQDPALMREYDKAEAIAERVSQRQLTPGGVSEFYTDEAWAFISNFPGSFLALTLKRAYMLLNGYEISAERPFYYFGNDSILFRILTWDFLISFPAGLILPLFVGGVIATFNKFRRNALLYCFAIGAASFPLLFYVTVDSRGVFMLAAIPFAAAGALKLVEWARANKTTKLATVGTAVLIALIISNVDFADFDEDPAGAFTHLGNIHWNAGDIDKAEQVFKKGLAIDPDSPVLNNNLGNVYYKKRVFEEAEKKYNRAILADPDYEAARKNRIRLYERWGREEILLKEYRDFLDLFPNSKWGLFRIADYYVENLQNDSALVYFEKLVTLFPGDPDARFGLANLYAKTGNPEKAREIYEEMVQIYPEEPAVHLNLGMVYAQLGETYLAEEQFEQTLFYDSNSTFALYNLAQIYEERGDSALATGVYMNILMKDPDFFESRDSILEDIIKKSPGIPLESLDR